MEHKIELVEQLSLPTLSVRRRSAAKNLPLLLGQCFGDVMAYGISKEANLIGPAFVIYYNMDMDNLDIEIGFISEEPVQGNEEIQSSSIPAGKYVVAEHTGPYTEMEALYKSMGEFMVEKGLSPKGIAYEFYYNSPMEVAESQLKTKIMLACNY